MVTDIPLSLCWLNQHSLRTKCRFNLTLSKPSADQSIELLCFLFFQFLLAGQGSGGGRMSRRVLNDIRKGVNRMGHVGDKFNWLLSKKCFWQVKLFNPSLHNYLPPLELPLPGMKANDTETTPGVPWSLSSRWGEMEIVILIKYQSEMLNLVLKTVIVLKENLCVLCWTRLCFTMFLIIWVRNPIFPWFKEALQRQYLDVWSVQCANYLLR